jgi:mono/diheme cytochrome c family protein
MNARVLIESRGAYEAFVSGGEKNLGRDIFRGACAKCHGFNGKGDYGPSIVGSGVAQSAQGLAQIVRNGRNQANIPGVMPPVGRGWTHAEMNALVKYVQGNIVGG